MKISGFTIVRHGVRFDYPFIESVRSLLPIVDEYVINVGYGEDETLAELEAFAAKEPGGEKLKLFQSRWPLDDPEKKRGGQILAEQTNLALERCAGDWAIYLQADEILHEDDLEGLRAACAHYMGEPGIDALLFHYVHFYGSFDVIRLGRGAYRREVRAVKTGRCRSIGDAQSFRLLDGTKPAAALIPARIFHYGWVRPPEVMKQKTEFMDQLYHSAGGGTGDNYRYKKILGLADFPGSHPRVMHDRIARKAWKWDLEGSPLEWTWKDAKKVALDFAERLTGHRFFEYRSYRLRERAPEFAPAAPAPANSNAETKPTPGTRAP